MVATAPASRMSRRPTVTFSFRIGAGLLALGGVLALGLLERHLIARPRDAVDELRPTLAEMRIVSLW